MSKYNTGVYKVKFNYSNKVSHKMVTIVLTYLILTVNFFYII